jgi:hypothetical protein
MVEPPKYRLPAWIQAIWVAVLAPIFVLALVPPLTKIILGPVAIPALAILFSLTVLYNKAKTGMWFPAAKKSRE